jgi:hypothetical protein
MLSMTLKKSSHRSSGSIGSMCDTRFERRIDIGHDNLFSRFHHDPNSTLNVLSATRTILVTERDIDIPDSAGEAPQCKLQPHQGKVVILLTDGKVAVIDLDFHSDFSEKHSYGLHSTTIREHEHSQTQPLKLI